MRPTDDALTFTDDIARQLPPPRPGGVHDARLDAPIVVRRQSRGSAIASRVRDIVASVVLLTLSAPVVIVLAVIIKLDSPGPAIFSHMRVGKAQEPFRFFKFRTMWVDAARRFPEMYAYDYTAGDIERLQFKQVDDPRLTRVGRWLRRTSLDELPNLWNVLRGDMTLVGPRPEIPQMVAYYRHDQLAKFAVTPGLTGLAQVSGRNILPFQETIHHDLVYVASKSFFVDLRILAHRMGRHLPMGRAVKRDEPGRILSGFPIIDGRARRDASSQGRK